MINKKEIKARDIPQAKRINVTPQKVYSICTDKKCPIMINGLNVMTWGYEKWIVYAKQKGISWSNNKINEKCHHFVTVS